MTSDAESIASAERNYIETWRLLVSHASGGVVEENDSVVCVGVPAPVAFFNTAFVKPPADPVACIDGVKAFYAKRDKPFMLRFRDEESGAAAAACEAAGLISAGSSPLMFADIRGIAPPGDFDIRPVDAGNWPDHLATIADGFGMPLELVAGIFPPSVLKEDYYAVNVYFEGQTASTAALIVTDDIAGVYNVATPEPFRRRGLGEAATRAVIAEGARRGCTSTTLQASDMGYPIYERIGYRTIIRWPMFTSA